MHSEQQITVNRVENVKNVIHKMFFSRSVIILFAKDLAISCTISLFFPFFFFTNVKVFIFLNHEEKIHFYNIILQFSKVE